MVAGPAAMTVAPFMYSKLGFDANADFLPVAMLGAGAFVLAVHPSVPARNIAELVAYARGNPNALSFGSGGNGSAGHLCAEAFAARAGIKMFHVPYKGDAAAVNDLLGGQIQLMFTAPNVTIPHARSGRVKLMAVTTKERMASLPEVASVHESGLADFEYLGWIGLYAPAATPRATIDALTALWDKARTQPAVRAKLDGMGMFPPAKYDTREAFTAYLKTEVVRTTALVRELGLKPN
jgi:tripartite-type tricarboxylate transporter receptor subunit TctC